MHPVIKRLVRRAFRRLGYEIYRAGSAPTSTPDLWPWLRDTQRIQTIIDIGANNGDFAAFLANYFKAGATYAFEPLASCGPALRAKAASIPNLQVFNVALSDRPGKELLYENSYGPASSLLRVSESSKREFPQTVGETPALTEVAMLDDLLDAASLPRNVLIKLDVQGFEDRVIRGGWRVFSAAQCVLAEMSFVPMYEGQPLFEEVHELLVRLGFRFAGLKNQINSARSGQPLFAHCLYVRASASQ